MMIAEARMPIHAEDDIVLSRQRARETARQLGFGAVDQSRIATAVSELARNVVRYATDGRGEVAIREVAAAPEARERIGIEIVVSDDGPGIRDVDQALRDGFTSGGGMGLGLPGTRRLMDEMSIDSQPGRGTIVTIRKWRR
jgi:serine/threonine-protein kinase RsbT